MFICFMLFQLFFKFSIFLCVIEHLPSAWRSSKYRQIKQSLDEWMNLGHSICFSTEGFEWTKEGITFLC